MATSLIRNTLAAWHDANLRQNRHQCGLATIDGNEFSKKLLK